MNYSRNPVFKHYIGIDYSGAEPPDEGMAGLRAYRAEREGAPDEVPPQGRHWWQFANPGDLHQRIHATDVGEAVEVSVVRVYRSAEFYG